MKITADSLFHFTTSLPKLTSILVNKFQLTYCHEVYELDYEKHANYYPMVSFCDIPLAMANDQIEKYGNYAIGMSKEWAIENHLNPVVYIEKNSLLSKDVQSSLDTLLKLAQTLTNHVKTIGRINIAGVSKEIQAIKQNLHNPTNERTADNSIVISDELKAHLQSNSDNLQTAINNLAESTKEFRDFTNHVRGIGNSATNLFRYIKNYRGTLNRKNKKIENYRFYDEREWRYVPKIDDNRLKPTLNEEDYKKYRGSSKEKPFIKDIKLAFKADDVKYLIVKSHKDIPKIIKSIKSINDLTRNPNEGDILTTKILTVDQLNSDF